LFILFVSALANRVLSFDIMARSGGCQKITTGKCFAVAATRRGGDGRVAANRVSGYSAIRYLAAEKKTGEMNTGETKSNARNE